MSPRLPEPVVVLGGGGFIGSNLVRRLTRDGYPVTAVDLHFPAYREPAWHGASRLVRDLRDDAQAYDAVSGAGTVFQLAADMGGVEWFHSDRDYASALDNARINQTVIAACVRAGIPRLLFSCSACACATDEQMTPGYAPKLAEATVRGGTPDQLYGAEKRFALELYEKAPFDARVAILHTVFGPLQEHEGRRMKFPSAVATKALHARTTGRLALFGDGTQLRTYLYVDDAIDRLIQLASAPDNPGPVMVGATGAVTTAAVARLCLEIVQAQDAEIVYIPGPTGVQGRDCDLTKWTVHFGTPRQTALREAFTSFIGWLETL